MLCFQKRFNNFAERLLGDPEKPLKRRYNSVRLILVFLRSKLKGIVNPGMNIKSNCAGSFVTLKTANTDLDDQEMSCRLSDDFLKSPVFNCNCKNMNLLSFRIDTDIFDTMRVINEKLLCYP